MILGIDEAGRGPWAGPLVVGAVVLGEIQVEGLTDSKKLTKRRREQLYEVITTQAPAYASGWVSAAELDERGMSEALRLATRRAVKQIKVPYHEIIIDGTVNFLVGTALESYVSTLKKADLLIASVSAASIVAKVERDRYMTEQDVVYPGYGFAAHAGYGTARHIAAIEELGVTPEHRLSFAPLQKYRYPKVPSAVLSGSLAIPDGVGGVSSPDKRLVSLSARATSKAIGDQAETAAAEYLQCEGHEILARNWRTKFCEIDIVSQYGETMYFTEVKYRKRADQGGGLAAITSKKLRQMRFAAEYFMLKHHCEASPRLAVATVTGVDVMLEQWFAID